MDIEGTRSRLRAAGASEQFYAEMASRGLEFGPRFRGVEQAWVGAGEALGEIVARGEEEPREGESDWELSPWWLDACLQVAALAARSEDSDQNGPQDSHQNNDLYLPLSVERLEVYKPAGPPATRSWSHVTMRRIDDNTLAADINITTHDGFPLLRFLNLRFRKIKKSTPNISSYSVEWIEAPLQAAPIDITGHWLVLSEANDLGSDLSAEVCGELQKRGATWSLISSEKLTREIEGDAHLPLNRDPNGYRKALRNIVTAQGSLEGVLDLRPAETGTLEQLQVSDDEPQNLLPLNASLALLQALLLEQIHPARGLWLVTGSRHSGVGVSISAKGRAIQALRRTAVLEFPELSIHSLDLDTKANANSLLHAITTVKAEEMLLRGERILVPRLKASRLKEHIATAEVANTEIIPAESGLIEDLKSIFVPRSVPLDDEVEIEVCAHGVNFRDVMNALGMLPGSVRLLGGECARHSLEGRQPQRICGRRQGICLRTRIVSQICNCKCQQCLPRARRS